jgi:hypothetical protein
MFVKEGGHSILKRGQFSDNRGDKALELYPCGTKAPEMLSILP